MSWWVYLKDRSAVPNCSFGMGEGEFTPAWDGDEICQVPCYPSVDVESHSEGGTYAMGGIQSAELNVTYNYGSVFRLAWPEPIEGSGALEQMLDDKRASDVIPLLEKTVEKLGTHRYDDYWAPTPGNAGHALNVLLGWARQHPDAYFKVS